MKKDKSIDTLQRKLILGNSWPLLKATATYKFNAKVQQQELFLHKN